MEHKTSAFVYAFDPRVVCLDYLARTLVALGLPEQAMEVNDEAIREARRVSHRNSLALPLFFGGVVHHILGDRDGVEARCSELARLATEAGFHLWQAGSTVLHGWTLAEAGEIEAGRLEIRRGADEWRASGAEFMVPYFLALLAQIEMKSGFLNAALPPLEEADARVQRTGEGWFAAEILRLKGEVLVTLDRLDDAHLCFAHALETAERQKARFWELRAALSAARLDHDGTDALERVGRLRAGFSEGFGLPDLKAAHALVPETRRITVTYFR